MLWAWGGMLVALALTDFVARPVGSAPLVHLFELAFVLLILIALSCVTWYWLGGKESE